MIFRHMIVYAAVVLGVSLESPAALRIVTYNTAQGVRSGMSTIMDYVGTVNHDGIVRPADILLLQEQLSVTTTTQDIVNVMNALYGSGVYSRGSLNGDTTGAGRPGIVYNTSTVELLEEVKVNQTDGDGAARSTIRYKLRPVGYSSDDAVFYAYVSHFKATTSSDDRRAVEAGEIRANSNLLGNAHIIYAGDLNLYTSSEQAWQILTASGNGQAFDPVNRVGSWNNNSSFTDVHTQSPVTSSQFPGQITGGIDDRFDFQLVSGELKDNEGLSYITGSYYTLGNNDTHSLNGSVTSGTDATAAVRNALESTSDHLPVMADYQVPAVMQVTVDSMPAEIEIGGTYFLSVSVSNAANVTAAAGADELDYAISISGDVSLVGGPGSGTIPALGGSDQYTLELDTSTLGSKTSQLIVSSDSQGAENTDYVLDINYEVIDNNVVVTRSFNWNAFFRHDPNAVLGVDGDVDYFVQAFDEAGSSRILSVKNHDVSSGMVYVAMMDQLVDGDEIQIEGLAKGSGITLGCAYLTDTSTPYSLLSDLAPQSNVAGTDWTLLEQTYTYDDSSGHGYPVMVYAQLPAGAVCDVNEIAITTKAHTAIQWPVAATTIECPENPAMDFNGDCIVNLSDFQDYAIWWLDGQEGAVSPGQTAAVIITGVVDGPFTGPRAIELYVNGTVDLSEYSIERAQDGGAWADTTSLSGTYTSEFVYLISTQNSGVVKFDAVFGTDGDFANRPLLDAVVDGDGNDAFRLLKNTVVIDQVCWPASTDVYEDSYLYRNGFTGPDAGWVDTNWQIPGNDVLDGLAVEEVSGVVPFGSYSFIESNCTEQTALDLNEDCQVNLPDLIEFADTWMQCNRVPDWACLEY